MDGVVEARQALAGAMQDPAVLALAHRIAVNTGLIREDVPLSFVFEREPAIAAGLLALAEDYATLVRAVDGGDTINDEDEENT